MNDCFPQIILILDSLCDTLFCEGKFSQGLITVYYGSRMGLCILCFQWLWDNWSVEQKSSLLREGAPLIPQQSALQPCQTLDSLASGGPETFTTIHVKTQFSVAKKAVIRACGMAWAWNNAFALGCFVTWERQPFALSQRTIPLSSLPIVLLGLFCESLHDLFFLNVNSRGTQSELYLELSR